MSYEVRMTATAIDDEAAILSYLAEVYPPAIGHYYADFDRFISIVSQMPEIAQRWHLNPEYRCWVNYPYKIFYHIDSEKKIVNIASIIHGRQRGPHF